MKTQIINFLKKRVVWISLVVIFLLVLLNASGGSGDQLLYTVERKPFLIDLKVQGELKAMDSYDIKAPSNTWGQFRVTKLVPEGTLVKVSDFLIQFDTSEWQQKLLEAQNQLEKAEANLAQVIANNRSQMAELESNIKLETYSLEQSRLQAKNAIYESENKRKEIEFNLKKAEVRYKQLVEKKESTVKIHAASLKQAQLEVDQAELKVKRAQDDLNQLTVNSPAEGLVVYKEVWRGDRMGKLQVGHTAWRGQSLLEIPTQSKMKVSVKVNEVDISKIKLDQKVKITLDAVPDSIYSGQIKEIAALANKDRRTNKNVFDVEIYLNDYDDRLKPGMTASAQIIIDEIDDVLSVPLDAIFIEGERTWVVDEDGDEIDIKTGKSSSDFIIVESGLDDGDMIQLGKSGTIEGSKAKQKSNQRGSSSERVIIRM